MEGFVELIEEYEFEYAGEEVEKEEGRLKGVEEKEEERWEKEEERWEKSGNGNGVTPTRPKLAEWYVRRFAPARREDVVAMKEWNVSGLFGREGSLVFQDSSAVLESTFVGTDSFPLPDDRIRLSMFKPLKVLGRGGVGKVFLVLLKGTDKVYALKQLKKSEMLLRNKVQRVMTERDIYTTANHPFIVTMHASFQTKKKLYFVMEYCSGGEFFRVLQKQPNKRLSEEAAKFYAAEVILALEYLHVLGYVYRDLKPENVLMQADGHVALTDFDLSKEGESQLPKVVDNSKGILTRLRSFGSSRGNSHKSKLFDLDIVDTEPKLPRSLSFVGTEEYIAPEVIEGKSQTAAVDWWTLGVLLFEMVCGSTPFHGEDRTETFSRILHDDMAWPAEVSLSPECKNLIKRLLHKDPERRIGRDYGATELKKHKWFRGIAFDLIRNESPPIKPKVKDPLDLSQYRPIDEEFEFDELEVSDTDDECNPFAHFNRRTSRKQ